VRDDFHPKRNQARQKLATLPPARFEDLSSDVYFELARRYPEFKDEGGSVRSFSLPLLTVFYFILFLIWAECEWVPGFAFIGL
jgi:hypothetical protein